jgi:hypothetical protein
MGGLLGQKVSYGWCWDWGTSVQQTAVSNKKRQIRAGCLEHGALGLGWHWTTQDDGCGRKGQQGHLKLGCYN